jgi:hypothetical protein
MQAKDYSECCVACGLLTCLECFDDVENICILCPQEGLNICTAVCQDEAKDFIERCIKCSLLYCENCNGLGGGFCDACDFGRCDKCNNVLYENFDLYEEGEDTIETCKDCRNK